MSRLVINPRTPQAREIQLKPGDNFIGRGFANDFQVEDPSVSGSHCQIVVNGNSVVVKDLGSTNGTFINRAPIKEGTLQLGQTLQLGGVEMLFENDVPVGTTFAPLGTAATAPIGAAMPPPPVVGLKIGTAASPPPPPPAGIMIGASPLPPPPPQIRISPAPAAAAPMAGLRISGASAVATAVAEPPSAAVAPPMPPPIAATTPRKAPTGKSVCKFHPKSAARWNCPKCSRFFCDLCVTTRATHDGTSHVCRTCGVECAPIAVKVVIPAEVNFFTVLPTAFAFPFKKDGTFILAGATIVFTLLEYMNLIRGGGFIFFGMWSVRVIFYGYLFAYLKSVVHTTAYGDENEPALPDVTDIGQDLAAPCAQVFLTIFFCFAPAVALMIWAFFGETDNSALYMFVAVSFSCLYYPMAFLAVTMFDSVAAMNPLVVIPAIAKMPLQYIVACVFLGVVLLARWIGLTWLPVLIPVPVLPVVLATFIGIYLLNVQCRILGLLYYANRLRFGWFSRTS
ncbi:MAG: domain containing protein [Pedosphaera sp.]|nr:domain containing protein [Pedosphaera sp.]